MSDFSEAYTATIDRSGQIAKALKAAGFCADLQTIAALATMLGRALIEYEVPSEVCADILAAIVSDRSRKTVAISLEGGGLGVVTGSKAAPPLRPERDYVARLATSVEVLVSHFEYSREDIDRIVQSGVEWSHRMDTQNAPPALGEA